MHKKYIDADTHTHTKVIIIIIIFRFAESCYRKGRVCRRKKNNLGNSAATLFCALVFYFLNYFQQFFSLLFNLNFFDNAGLY